MEEAVPVHSELRSDPVEAQSHEGHVGDALHRAQGQALLHRGLQQAQVHLGGRTQGEPPQRRHNKQYLTAT